MIQNHCHLMFILRPTNSTMASTVNYIVTSSTDALLNQLNYRFHQVSKVKSSPFISKHI